MNDNPLNVLSVFQETILTNFPWKQAPEGINDQLAPKLVSFNDLFFKKEDVHNK